MGEMTKASFEQYWEQLDRDERESKFSNTTTIALCRLYPTLDPQDRSIIDGVLSEWVSSSDAGKRFDSSVLIREFGVRSALPALERRIKQLEGVQTAPEKYEIQKIQSIIAKLKQPR